MKKETQKKTSKCLAKSVPQKTVCGGGDQEASGQAQLPSAQVSSQHSKCESNLFYLEHHLHRSCRLLSTQSPFLVSVVVPASRKAKLFALSCPLKAE